MELVVQLIMVAVVALTAVCAVASPFWIGKPREPWGPMEVVAYMIQLALAIPVALYVFGVGQ